MDNATPEFIPYRFPQWKWIIIPLLAIALLAIHGLHLQDFIADPTNPPYLVKWLKDQLIPIFGVLGIFISIFFIIIILLGIPFAILGIFALFPLIAFSFLLWRWLPEKPSASQKLFVLIGTALFSMLAVILQWMQDEASRSHDGQGGIAMIAITASAFALVWIFSKLIGLMSNLSFPFWLFVNPFMRLQGHPKAE